MIRSDNLYSPRCKYLRWLSDIFMWENISSFCNRYCIFHPHPSRGNRVSGVRDAWLRLYTIYDYVITDEHHLYFIFLILFSPRRGEGGHKVLLHSTKKRKKKKKKKLPCHDRPRWSCKTLGPFHSKPRSLPHEYMHQRPCPERITRDFRISHHIHHSFDFYRSFFCHSKQKVIFSLYTLRYNFSGACACGTCVLR